VWLMPAARSATENPRDVWKRSYPPHCSICNCARRPRQVARQGRQDFLAVPGSPTGQHFRMDALADAPEQQGQLGINRRGGALPRRLDLRPNVAR